MSDKHLNHPKVLDQEENVYYVDFGGSANFEFIEMPEYTETADDIESEFLKANSSFKSQSFIISLTALNIVISILILTMFIFLASSL